jgi:hypothetical protein
MKEWTNELINYWNKLMNKLLKYEWMIEWMNTWTNDRMKNEGRIYEWLNKWMNKLLKYEWRKEWIMENKEPKLWCKKLQFRLSALQFYVNWRSDQWWRKPERSSQTRRVDTKAMVPGSIRFGSITTKSRNNFDVTINLDLLTGGKLGRLLSAC